MEDPLRDLRVNVDCSFTLWMSHIVGHGYTTALARERNEMGVIEALIENGMMQKIWMPPESILGVYKGKYYFIFARTVECEYTQIEQATVKTQPIMKRKRPDKPMRRLW
jgi:hypothetical protein